MRTIFSTKFLISRRFVGQFGAIALFTLLLVWGSHARQSGSPVDVTGSASITPVADGFQVGFPNPVALSEVVYDGDYQGPYELITPRSNDATQEAFDLIDKALESQPDDPRLLDTKGLIYLKNGQPQDAIPLLERAVEISCEGPIYVLHLAYAQLMNGENEKSVTTFEKVRAILITRTDQLFRDNRAMFDEMEMKLGGPADL